MTAADRKRVEEIRGRMATSVAAHGWDASYRAARAVEMSAHDDERFLLALLDAQSAVLHDLQHESGYDAGYRAGAAEMRGRAAAEIQRLADKLPHNRTARQDGGWVALTRAAASVATMPLIPAPEGRIVWPDVTAP